MKSPCKNICKLHENGVNCIGCGRTTDDLTKWMRLSPEEKRERTTEGKRWLRKYGPMAN